MQFSFFIGTHTFVEMLIERSSNKSVL